MPTEWGDAMKAFVAAVIGCLVIAVGAAVTLGSMDMSVQTVRKSDGAR
jgi:hypothetical protein